MSALCDIRLNCRGSEYIWLIKGDARPLFSLFNGYILVSQGSWVRYPVWQHTFVSPYAFSRRAVVSYWRKYVHEVLDNRLRGLSLSRKNVVRLTDRPDMTLDVYRGCKTTLQQQRHQRIYNGTFLTVRNIYLCLAY